MADHDLIEYQKNLEEQMRGRLEEYRAQLMIDAGISEEQRDAELDEVFGDDNESRKKLITALSQKIEITEREADDRSTDARIESAINDFRFECEKRIIGNFEKLKQNL